MPYIASLDFCFSYLFACVSLCITFFFISFFKLEDNYSIVMVSAIHQHESAIGIHASHPSWTLLSSLSPSHPSRLSQSTSFGYITFFKNLNKHWVWSLKLFFFNSSFLELGFPGDSDSKESACNVWDLGSIPGSGRSPGEGNGNPFQHSCLENPMDRGAW